MKRKLTVIFDIDLPEEDMIDALSQQFYRALEIAEDKDVLIESSKLMFSPVSYTRELRDGSTINSGEITQTWEIE